MSKFQEYVEATGYMWGVDDYIVNTMFFNIIEARGFYNENFSPQMLNLALQKYKFAWHTVEILLMDKVRTAKDENEKQDLQKFIYTMEAWIARADELKRPPLTMNLFQKQQEEVKNISDLMEIVDAIDALLMKCIRNSGMWLRENFEFDPGQAIREKFRY